MKLNYRRTLFVGFAFFLICAFWQAYDSIIPKILTDKFGMSQANSGIVMALDNVLALFMLPLFGTLSDRCRSRMGRRTPFILFGTLAAAVLLVVLTFADGMQLENISAVRDMDTQATLNVLYDDNQGQTLMTPEGDQYVLSDEAQDGVTAISREAFLTMTLDTEDYARYVTPARQAYAHRRTMQNPTPLILFIAVLLLLLIAMATFRSPAVALMPDVTMKPLRSKANAIINLMGSAGGIIILAMGTVFATGAAKNALMPYGTFFGIVSGLMLVSLLIFMLTVREPKFVEEMHEQSRKYGIEEKEEEQASGDRKLSSEERKSLVFILLSIVLWFMGYNAVTSKYSVYADKVLGRDYNMTLIIAQAAAIISYLPVGIIASKVGRKKTILAGVVMLTVAFGTASFLRADDSPLLMNCMFALAGIAWATINVNSFPMVVEMCRGGDVGKYTGFYYTASMAAQTITPYLSGRLMDKRGMTALFPYATVFVALAFVTMLFVHHGDSKPEARRGLEALDND
ncbi:MAG: MFS transporter [Clostridia bacterium]|nr:MFS transporter [Clostridia bacterium]